MNSPPATAVPADHRQTRATEFSLVRVRWFAVAFGLFQVSQLGSAPPFPPGWVVPVSYTSMAVLAVGNFIISKVARSDDARVLRRVGMFAFSLDALVVFTNVWAGTYDRNGTPWTLAFVLPLEGAIRYQLRGAVVSIAAFSLAESARELYRLSLFEDLTFQVSSVTYRLGLFSLIALVAGMMASSSERAREAAEQRAEELDSLADRERSARAEIQAFYDVVTAGLAAGAFHETLDDMVGAIARAFNYEMFAIRLLEESPDGPVLRCVGAYGFPDGTLGRSLPANAGVVGRAILTERAQLVAETMNDPDYVAWAPGAQSEMAVPIRARERLIGVVDVESTEPHRFGPGDIERLERLAPQIELVITNARLLAQERATVERLRELDMMKSDFVAVTSHELRTPLTAVQGFIKTLRRPDVRLSPSEMAEFLAIVDRQAERLTRLVEELLLTARIDAGTVDLQMDSVEVATVLGDVLLELDHERRRVQLAIDPALPRLVTDGQRLGQVARNLIENALKFSPHEAMVRVTAVAEGDSLIMEIADRGPGIPAHELPHIFERFHQVGGAPRRRGQGLGLGLYIVRNIVEALNGTVSVRSSPEGTSFVVRIPLVRVEDRRLRTGT